MAAYVALSAAADAGVPCLAEDDGEMAAHEAPSSADMPDRWVVLRRGCQRMVLFLGPPHADLVDSLRRLPVMIGLALSSSEIRGLKAVGSYDYVFIALNGRPDTAFGEALKDLARTDWSIDRQVSLPVIISQGTSFGILTRKQFSKGDF